MLQKVINLKLLILITLIIITSYFFHFPIIIQDAITLEAVPEYDIEISVWRIIFEPILGLLLFFNRALYALEELLILLYWILGLYCFFIIKNLFFDYKKTSSKLKYFAHYAIRIPIIVVIWFSFTVLILFIPLPNNTIINNSQDSVLVSTHSHSEFSHDGIISQQGLWEWHKKNNFDAFFITEHSHHEKSFEFSEKQKQGNFPQSPLIFTGEEYSGSNHIALLGLKNNFVTKDMSDSDVINRVQSDNGAVIVNHWFRDMKNSLEYYKNLGVDGFEIENSGKKLYYDRSLYEEIKNFCRVNNLIMIGGLDYHGYRRSCSIWNAFKIPHWNNLTYQEKEKEIIKTIRERDQTKLQVLIYKDRPYYPESDLSLSPFRTLLNYFRTLNIYQVVSWIVWILILSFVSKNFSGKKDIVILSGISGSVFLFLLGLNYNSKIKAVETYNETYKEFSNVLLFVGFFLMIYCLLVLFFTIYKKDPLLQK